MILSKAPPPSVLQAVYAHISDKKLPLSRAERGLLSASFVKTFWDFILAGKYQSLQSSNGKKTFYRFHSPENAAYPKIVELFSRKPTQLKKFIDSR
jgi:hypothetical protein